MTTATFTIDNVWTRIDADPKLIAKIDDELSYFVDGYKFMPAHKKGWDGKRRLLQASRFPTGLLEDAGEIATNLGYQIEVKDARVKPPENFKDFFLRGADERENQLEAVQAAVERERGIIWAGTGSGKTNVMAGIIQVLNLPAIMMVDRVDIASQTRKRWIQLLGRRDIGIFTGSQKTDGNIVCATFKSLVSRYEQDKKDRTFHLRDWLKKFQVLCIDEAHHSMASTYFAMINECNAYYRYGFSATAEKSAEFVYKTGQKGARLHLVGATGPPLHIYRTGQGVLDGYMVKAQIEMRQWHPDSPDRSWKADDFAINDRVYKWVGKKTELVIIKGKQVRRPLPPDKVLPGLYTVGITDNVERNAAVVKAVIDLYEEGRTVLVLVQNIGHGNLLKRNILKLINADVQFLHGTHSKSQREEGRATFTSGKAPILIASTIFDEGVDMPEVDGLVLAGAGKAQHKAIQRIGRGQRPMDGKVDLKAIDFMDTHSKILWKHSKERKAAYDSDKDAYEVILTK